MPPKKRAKVEESVLERAWQHYRNFVDSCDDDEEGIIEELESIIELVPEVSTAPDLVANRNDLLPVLISMCHYQIASNLISQSLDSEEDFDREIKKHLQNSIRLFPRNCATWSMGANYARIHNAVPATTTLCWYEKAADFASALRKKALDMLEDELHDEDTKEWMEMLILNAMLGVEYLIPEETDVEGIEEDLEVEENFGFFSTSAVESTARFMCAMLTSSLGNHERCLDHLQYFDVTHRLHPNVWRQSVDEATTDGPVLFTGNILPEPLYNAICKTFSSDACYWKESDYNHRGYHSYFIRTLCDPSNLIEEVIINHLLPLAKKCYAGEGEIVGAEWWPHHRPIQANLGHNLHFDTDEAMLQQESVISHPVLSSVLYLTTGGKGLAGPTIILDQKPDSKEVATKCWTCSPQDNTFLLFDGSLLHGVLPCPGEVRFESENVDNGDILYWEKQSKRIDLPHRLTFMVGFWTRNVPEKIKNPREYGPCGPLPSPDSNEWVKNILTFPKSVPSTQNVVKTYLPTISPAWEKIEVSEGEKLSMPQAIDHRFFVKGAPEFFRNALFEDHDEDLVSKG
jgi:hypothetical protein